MGKVIIQAATIVLAIPQRTAESRRVAPTPIIAELALWLVLTGLPSCEATSITVAAGEKVTLTISCDDAKITGLSIFRSALDAADSSDCRWIADVAVGNATGSNEFIDYNLILPGTSQAVLISNAPETDAMDYRQLMPFVRMELPFGLNSIVGYPYLYMLYTYLRLAKLKNDRTMGSFHQLYTNIRWTKSTF